MWSIPFLTVSALVGFKTFCAKRYTRESPTNFRVVIASRRFGRTACICCRGDAALLDGDSSHVVGNGRDANRTTNNVHDPSGLLHLRHAWDFIVANSVKSKAIPVARYVHWFFLSDRWPGILLYRSSLGYAAVVDTGRHIFVRLSGRSTPVAQLEERLVLLRLAENPKRV